MTTHADRWPYHPDTPHTDTWPCHCKTCRDRVAAAARRTSRRVRRDLDRWMVDPDYLRDRKR